MRGLGTDHLISGPMRGLKNCIQWRKQTDRTKDGHGDSMKIMNKCVSYLIMLFQILKT